MGDGAVTVSERGIILYANLRLADLIGADRAALLGRDVTARRRVRGGHAPVPAGRDRPGTTQQEELELVHAEAPPCRCSPR